jgi:hypothetical protein
VTTITLFLITGLLWLTQSLEAGERGWRQSH